MAVAATALTLATIALMALVLRMFLRSLAGPGAGAWWTIGWLLPAALFLEPVRNTLNYGQVDVALMALVAADCLARGPRWPRGALIGLAAAVKLTPAAFVLFFLLRRDWPAVRAAAVSFAVSTGGSPSFLFDWHDSVRYWTSVVFQAGRPGSPAYAANQSIQGVLARAVPCSANARPGGPAWLALRHRHRRGGRLPRHAARARPGHECVGAVPQRVRGPADLAHLVVASLGVGRDRDADTGAAQRAAPAFRRARARRRRAGGVWRRAPVVR